MPLSKSQLAKADWKVVFSYEYEGKGFKVFSADGINGLTISHQWTRGSKVKISYRTCDRDFDSPSEACRFFNEQERGGSNVAGSPESIAARKSAGG